MRLNKITFALLFATLFTAVSCSDNDDNQSNSVETPATYTFLRNGITSVDYGGQSSRLLMLEEMGNYIKNDERLSEKNKELNPLEWTKLMNNYKNTAEEIVLNEYVFI